MLNFLLGMWLVDSFLERQQQQHEALIAAIKPEAPPVVEPAWVTPVEVSEPDAGDFPLRRRGNLN